MNSATAMTTRKSPSSQFYITVSELVMTSEGVEVQAKDMSSFYLNKIFLALIDHWV